MSDETTNPGTTAARKWTRGHAKLRRWAAKRKLTASEVADMIGADRQYVHVLLRARFTPKLVMAKKIEEATNGAVAVDLWADRYRGDIETLPALRGERGDTFQRPVRGCPRVEETPEED